MEFIISVFEFINFEHVGMTFFAALQHGLYLEQDKNCNYFYGQC